MRRPRTLAPVSLWIAALAILGIGCGAAHTVRVLPGAPPPSPERVNTRASLLYFGHLTDLHVTDAMSPMRVEMIDPAQVGDWLFVAAWRPQEALSARALDRAIRQMNARKTSRLLQGDGSRAEMALALLTGDLVDNQQQNELQWVTDTLAGRRVDPYSGVAPGTGECLGLTPSEREALRARVATRLYSGVQRYRQYPSTTPAAWKVSFYDPDLPPPQTSSPVTPHYDLPQIPGLLERALEPFPTAGIDVPFFVARGNHDALVQGNYVISWLAEAYSFSKYGVSTTGCRKAYPTAILDPYAVPFSAGPYSPERQQQTASKMAQLYENFRGEEVSQGVPPDPRRAQLFSPDFPGRFAEFPFAAGYAFVPEALRAASDGYAHYYRWSPKPGLLFLSLDTNVEGGGPPNPNGNLDDPQFRWLAEQLEGAPEDTLVVVFAHHALSTMDNRGPNRCALPGAGCDQDPRPAAPVHLGCPVIDGAMSCEAPLRPGSPDNLRDLLLAHENVVLLVNGHTHANRVEPFSAPSGSGFWQVTTASIVEWPQQSRTLELMDNRDGTLSVFATLVPAFADGDAAWPIGPASGYSDDEVARVARLLALGDDEWRDGPGRTALGRFELRDGVRVNLDGDVELVLGDPRTSDAAAPRP